MEEFRKTKASDHGRMSYNTQVRLDCLIKSTLLNSRGKYFHEFFSQSEYSEVSNKREGWNKLVSGKICQFLQSFELKKISMGPRAFLPIK